MFNAAYVVARKKEVAFAKKTAFWKKETLDIFENKGPNSFCGSNAGVLKKEGAGYFHILLRILLQKKEISETPNFP